MNTARRGLAEAMQTNRKRWAIGLGAALLLSVVTAMIGYLLIIGNSYRPLVLPELSLRASTGSSALGSGDLHGTWAISKGSIAGYRTREKLSVLPVSSEATGRTRALRGTARVTGSNANLVLEAATFQADLRTLASDRPERDERIHSLGLESDRYPMASFDLVGPVKITTNAATQSGPIHIDGAGKLTLHGVTRLVAIPVAIAMNGDRIEVLGSFGFRFDEFRIQAPNIYGLVSVEPTATLEFLLVLEYANNL